MIKNYGARAHDFGTDQIDALIAALVKWELDGVQLAPLKIFKNIASHEDFIEGTYKNEIIKAFKDSGKLIHVLGCYLNQAHPDVMIQEQFRSIVKGYIDVASLDKELFGCVGTESFTLNADRTPHPDDHSEIGYQTFLKAALEIVEHAEAKNVYFAVEPVYSHIIYDIKTTQRLITDIASPNLKLIFDPCNMMSPEIAPRQEQFFDDFVTQFESRIVDIHLKDFKYIDGKKTNFTAGNGDLDYGALYRVLQSANQPVNMLLEGFDINHIEKAIGFMKRL